MSKPLMHVTEQPLLTNDPNLGPYFFVEWDPKDRTPTATVGGMNLVTDLPDLMERLLHAVDELREIQKHLQRGQANG